MKQQKQPRVLWTGRLVYGEDLEYARHGWKTADAPEGFNVSSSDMLPLTHDLLEHTARESNSVYNEFRALGAVLAVRGEITLDNRFSYEKNICGDWSGLAYDLMNDPESVEWCELLALPGDDQHAGMYFTREQYKMWLRSAWQGYCYSSDEASMLTARLFCTRARHAFNAMQEGYKAACERYADIANMRAVFIRVQANLRRMLTVENAEIYGECECTVYADGYVYIEWPEAEDDDDGEETDDGELE